MKVICISILLFIMACNPASKTTVPEGHGDTPENVRLKPGNWISLFNGQNLEGWHGFNKTGPVSNWVVDQGVLHCLGRAQGDTGGDIVTDREFENFELSWEWKLAPGANSGLMYHVQEQPKYSAPWQTGPEYQLIDDKGYKGKLEPWQQAAADYAMHPANENKELKPVGEWNSSRIVFNRGKVEHWLNGKKVVEFTAWTAAWEKEKREGKWKDHPDYGSARKGKIALQDHGDKAWFRNIYIREL